MELHCCQGLYAVLWVALLGGCYYAYAMASASSRCAYEMQQQAELLMRLHSTPSSKGMVMV